MPSRPVGTAFLAAMLSIAAASATSAQTASAHPNFTGIWIMDAGKSEPSQLTPSGSTYTIAQRSDSIILDREDIGGPMGAGKAHSVYGLDGKAWTNTLDAGGNPIPFTSVLSWEKDALMIRSTGAYNGTPFEESDSWTLSADGQVLTVHVVVTFSGQEFASPTWVFNKKK